MKTIMIAAKTVSKPALSSQTTQGGAILLVKGNDKPTKGGAPSSKGPGKSSFFDPR